jgi:8-oxo-dGTP pyrophosphatase MutT (NUDIX family)
MPPQFHTTDSWSSLVINEVVSTTGAVVGYILVIDHHKRDPLWKLAAGHKEPEETPLETAMRENQGETGLRLPREAYQELSDFHEWRTRPSGHWSLLFKATVRLDQVGLINPHDHGNEGEEVKYFTLAELSELISGRGILEFHLGKMVKAGCTLS